MHIPTLLIGIAALAFGLYTTWARVNKPSQLGKLEAMKSRWGNQAGTIIHLIAYTVMPIVVGMVFIVSGVQGKSIF